MNVRLIETIRDIIGMILQFLIIYCLDILIFNSMNYVVQGRYLLPFAIVPLIIICYLMLRNLKRLPFAVLPLAIYLGLIIYIPFDNTAKALFIVEYVILVGFFFKNWISKIFTAYVNMPPISATLLFLALQLTNVSTIAYYCGLLYLGLSVIEKYMRNVIVYVYNNNDVKKLPLKQIRKLNGFYAGIFLVVSIVLVIAGRIIGLDRYMNMAIQSFKVWMNGKYLFNDMEFNIIEDNVEVGGIDNQESEILGQGKGGFNIFNILLPLLKIFLLVLATLVIVKIVKGIFKTIKNSYYKGTSDIDSISYINIDEDDSFEKVSKKSVFFRGRMNTSEKIRHIYYKKILKHSKKEADKLASMTPTEITTYAIKKNTDKEKELTMLYEKARYGKDICSENELNKMKEL